MRAVWEGAFSTRLLCAAAEAGGGGDAPIKGHGEAAEARDQRREGEQKKGTHLGDGDSRDVYACYWWLTRCPGVICTEKDLSSVEG